MAARQLSTKSVEGVCDLCFREADGWAVGLCDHPVCCLCASKMRVLCGQRECAVCRATMDQIIFLAGIKPFRSLKLSSLKWDSENSVFFENDRLMTDYYKILSYSCPECQSVQPNMRKLNVHTRKTHGLHYCEICVEDLKLFPSERKVYTQTDLVRHSRKGDPDDTSHKGHPLCRFCDKRYFDDDQLHFHLHKFHFWCHFCESDGKQDYFPDYSELKHHFKQKHYLCEKDDCANRHMDVAFRTRIDYQAHLSSAHSQKMSKNETKQNKHISNIQLGFKYTRPSDVGHAVADKRDVEKGRSAASRKKSSREELDVAKAMSLSLADKNDTRETTTTTKVVNSTPSSSSKDAPLELSVSKPPPGFKKIQGKTADEEFPSIVKDVTSSNDPPPPLTWSHNSSLGNLHGRDFPVLTTQAESNPPPGLEKNFASKVKPKTLVVRLKELLQNEKNFNEFKLLSSEFKIGRMDAGAYETCCCALFGSAKWDSVFDDLVKTFPDQRGREDLERAHASRHPSTGTRKQKHKSKKGQQKPSQQSGVWGGGGSSSGSTAPVTDQTNNELYPPLSSATPVPTPPARWGHKVAV